MTRAAQLELAPPALAPLRNSVAAAAPTPAPIDRAAMGIIDDYYGGYENLHSHGYDYDAGSSPQILAEAALTA